MPRGRKNALKTRMDAMRAQDPAMAEVSRLDDNADTFAVGVREALREARTTQGLSMSALAERMQVTQPTVHAIERGDGDLGVKTVARYLGALDLDLMQFLTDLRRSVHENAPATPGGSEEPAEGRALAAAPRSDG